MKKIYVLIIATLFTINIAKAQWQQTSLDSINIYTLAANGNNIYAGTDSGGVYVSTCSCRASLDHHAVFALVGFGQDHLDHLFLGRRDVLAHEIGPDRKFPVPAVHEYRKLNGFGPSEIDESVQRRPNGPARK